MARMISKDEFRKSISDAIVDRAEKVADEMYEILCSGAAERLDEVVRSMVLNLGETAIVAALKHGEDVQKERGVGCPNCGEQMRFKQRRPMILRTSLTGQQRQVVSMYFLCDDCHVGAMGLRQMLRLDEDGFTPFLRELSIRAGTIEPFESASTELLGAMAGVTVSGSKVHSLSAKAGEVALALAEDGALGESRPLRVGEKLYVEIDGGMTFIDKEWKEVKVAIAFPSDDRIEVSRKRKEVFHRRVCATLDTREELAEQVYAMVEPYLPRMADGSPIIEGNVVVLADGAPWIQNLVKEVLPGAFVILDWYHVCEHVAETALALYPDKEPQRKGWVTRQMNLLDKGGANTLLRRLAHRSMKLEPGSKAQEAVAKLHAYLHERKEHLRYSYARSEGLDVGSGAIESAIDHVVQQRMKRSGMRWKRGGAKAILALRCAYRSTGGMDALFRSISEAA